MSSRDVWIDDDLRNVVLPADLLPKLHSIAALDDAELDRSLRDVPVPEGLLDRLQSIGSLDEVDLDDELRHVAAPISLADRLRRLPVSLRRNDNTKVVVRWLSIAASLLVAATIGYVAAVSPWLFGRPKLPDRGAPQQIAQQAAGARSGSSTNRPAQVKNDQPQLVESPAPVATSPKIATSTPSDNVPSPSPPSPELLANVRTNVVAAEGSVAETPLSGDSAPLGAGTSIDRLPPLESLPKPVWRGITPPRERGYDLMFQLKHGVHPFVSAGASPALAVCPVPLVTSSASFDEALQQVSQHKLPSAHKVRTEEFLAAMDYDFPLPEESAIGIRTALGPSPWGMPGSSLFQVAAQAKAIGQRTGPVHMVVLLDMSASMYWEGRWQRARFGLRDYIDRMQPEDRLSVVLLGDKAKILTELRSPSQARQALELWPDRPSAKTINVVDAVEMADEVIGRDADRMPARIVLLTDGLLQLTEPVNERIESVVRSATDRGHRFEVLDVRQEETLDDELQHLASSAAGKAESSGVVSHALTASDIRWRLAEIAEGQSQLVAAKATMKVTFKPQSVAMYRLLGHEATSVAGLISTTIEADLRAGEAATGLFEVVLKPDGEETIATVEVSWQDPKSGRMQSARQTVSRLQLAPSFHQSPLSLQLAALAAQTAEILRNSPFAPPHSHSLASVAELGGQLNLRLRESPSFAKLMTLVEEAQRSTVVTP